MAHVYSSRSFDGPETMQAQSGRFEPRETMSSSATVPKGSLTSDFYKCSPMPKRFNQPELFQGYGAKEVNPLYRTSNSAYGSRAPSVHTMQTAYHSMSQEFTGSLGKCGMYRNHSLNCAVDKSRVPDY